MPMCCTLNCFLGCIYTVYHIVYIVFLVLNWLSNLEFWLPKKKDQVVRIGVMGGGFRGFGQCPKENVFFSLTPSLSDDDNYWFFGSILYQTKSMDTKTKSIQSQLQSTPRPIWIKPKFYCSPPLSHSQALLQPPRLLNSDFIMIVWLDVVVKYCWN